MDFTGGVIILLTFRLALYNGKRYCLIFYLKTAARGGVMVNALHYKLADRGFDSRWCHWNFSVT